MRLKFRYSFFALLLTVMLLLETAVTVAAKTASLDQEKKGSISITLKENDEKQTPISGAVMDLYHVGRLQSDDRGITFSFTEEFENCGMSLKDLDAPELAEQLAVFALENGLDRLQETTASNASAAFENLELGLYLVAQEGAVSGYDPVKPFLVSLPMTSPDGSGWIYDVDASPKTSPRPDDHETLPTLPPEPDQPPCLEETGQLNWPVPVLSGVGLVLMLTGWLLRKPYEG